MNQKLLLLGAIALILVGAGSYVLGTKKSQPVAENKVTTQLSPTADETASWNTYTHSNFTFKYPRNWYPEDNPNYPGGNNVSFFLAGTEADHSYGDHKGNEVFSFEFSEDNRTLEELKKNYYQKAVDFTIGAKPAIKTSFNLLIVKPSGNKMLNIVGGIEAAKPYLDQILSTFRFFP